MACAEISEKADAGNETCPWETSAEMVQGVRYGGADVPRRVSRPFEPQLSALGGQPETVQPEMQNLYAIIKRNEYENISRRETEMTLGSKWRCVRLFEGGKDLGVREVGKVQGNAVAFLKPDGKLSWLWWPKAKDVQVEENAFTVLQNGVPKLKYIYAG